MTESETPVLDKIVDLAIPVVGLFVVYMVIETLVGIPFEVKMGLLLGLGFVSGVLLGIGFALNYPEMAVNIYDGLFGE